MDRKTILVSAVLAFGVSALVSRIDLRGETSPPSRVAPRAAAPATGASYASLLAELDQRIDGLQTRANSRPGDWLTRMHLGSALLERAGLTNQMGDFARVQAVLDDAFSIAPAGSGPLLLAARFNYSIHRLGAAEEYLAMIERRAVPRRDDQLMARVLRAEIAVQRGEYEGALAELTALAAAAPVVATAELALYHAKTGKPGEAEALLEDALRSTGTNDPRRRAWIKLQLGIVAMERGELGIALKHLQEADAELAGWWLVQEHIAEIHNRRDRHAEAIAIYEELVRTADLPQHMDALAALYRHTGEPQRAEELIARAAARWDEQLARFPESAMGHALHHYLQFGPPERALALAQANHVARPGGDAQVSLAQAYLQAGQAAEALALVEKALASPYRTARLHDIAAKAHTALGHTAAAEEQMSLLLAVNPRYSSDDHSH
ncbi:tetratricopeptide repeat protein [Nannocystis radixulma]|uniref:Tetratricopeptide repeat protein n=1 Tax=Nannocystis radixulma TaxID=2995305 RepID=A0ABT5BHX1_9BACT|nr:tetratricopeptide repeat protein [Nannocystis radixulma]MDC0673013.1 tetratricopeptide repeat protein [Nannocystis radixulma]